MTYEITICLTGVYIDNSKIKYKCPGLQDVIIGDVIKK